MKKKLLIILTFTILINVAAVFAQPSANNTASLREKLQTNLDDWHGKAKFAGATIGVCQADGNCFAIATGYSDLESKTKMKPGDIMCAGSVGKTYAAAVAMQLIHEKKIGLDDKIEKYLGGEKWFSRLPNSKDITIRQLMTHSSGLIRYEFKDQFTKDLTANPDKVWTPLELISYLFDEKAPFEAGKGWDYSDTNFIVLGMIMEKVTGKTYYQLAKERVLKPMKLRNTFPQDKRKLKGLIQGYAGNDNPFGGKDRVLENGKFIINPQFEWTGGGMIANTEDLARWTKMIYEGKAFAPEMVSKMIDGVDAPMLGKGSKYGLGSIIRPTPLGVTYGHSGFFPGYMTDTMYFPDHKLSLAIQINSSVPRNIGKNPARVLIEMAEIITKDEL
ncbi:MAG: serine hydrolase domain-containing protein [Pyrinomonadaceae bacterium]